MMIYIGGQNLILEYTSGTMPWELTTHLLRFVAPLSYAPSLEIIAEWMRANEVKKLSLHF